MAVNPVVRAVPVVFACQGCALDRVARQAAAELERRGIAEAAVASGDAGKARSRFPIHALEGCETGCATKWLASQGVRVERAVVLDAQRDPAAELARLLAKYY